ncbi:hypothetical protein TNCT_12351 [Trichonephila clavata]|uniref:Uncharacterized protein n=1 Tax=Trichonephila clavata TaxID=2740835 RepID=A0A8X6KPW3_TRICU|nr:hypothetical protein TNCT_12351 [Trichonephila clavata]
MDAKRKQKKGEEDRIQIDALQICVERSVLVSSSLVATTLPIASEREIGHVPATPSMVYRHLSLPFAVGGLQGKV